MLWYAAASAYLHHRRRGNPALPWKLLALSAFCVGCAFMRAGSVAGGLLLRIASLAAIVLVGRSASAAR